MGANEMRSITLLSVCFLPFVFLVACRQEMTQNGNGPIAKDFKIVAHYYPGYSKWQPWECAITGDGTVVKSEEPAQKQVTLSEIDVRNLAAKIREADFYGLRKKYSYKGVTDNPTLVLTVTQNGRTHEVSVYAQLPGRRQRSQQIPISLVRDPQKSALTQSGSEAGTLRAPTQCRREVPLPNLALGPELKDH